MATYEEIEPFVELVDKQSEAAGGPAMSKFEVVTAMAFAAFADAPIDVAVVEVGMGGRWDATNVVDAPVAVITPIGIDHTEYLGTEIADIAGEKAGIIVRQKDDLVPVDTVAVIGRQVPEAMEVVLAETVRGRRRGRSRGLRVRGAGPAGGGRRPAARTAGPRRGVLRRSSCRCTASIRPTTPSSHWPPSRRSSARARERQLDIDAVRAGFAAAASPGRLERMRSAPTVFIDAAHNPAGAAALAQTLAEEFDFRFLVGVVSVMADKDVDGILAALEPAFDQIVVTHNGSPRALDVETPRARGRGAIRAGAGDRSRQPCPTPSRPRPRWSRRPGMRATALRQRHRHHRVGRHRRRGAHAVRAGPRMSEPTGRHAGRSPDPWKSFRGVMAGTLILEAIVVLLALPVVVAVGRRADAVTASYLIGVAVLLVLLAGLQGRSWAIWANLGMQLLLIAGWVVIRASASSALLFAGVWLLMVYLRAEVLRRQKRGLLPGNSRRPAAV